MNTNILFLQRDNKISLAVNVLVFTSFRLRVRDTELISKNGKKIMLSNSVFMPRPFSSLLSTLHISLSLSLLHTYAQFLHLILLHSSSLYFLSVGLNTLLFN